MIAYAQTHTHTNRLADGQKSYNTMLIVIYTISYRDFELQAFCNGQFMIFFFTSHFDFVMETHGTFPSHQTRARDKIKVNYFT